MMPWHGVEQACWHRPPRRRPPPGQLGRGVAALGWAVSVRRCPGARRPLQRAAFGHLACLP
eukprot:2111487-Alexandrium_andersonii.AAC.1